MQPDKAAAVRGWLSKAANDLRGAHIDLDADPPLIEDALFHCQQAAEKSLKAFLTGHDTPFKKTHDLDELGRACLELDSTLRNAVQPAVPLTVFAWEFRYPGDTQVPSMNEVREYLAVANRLYTAILARVPHSCHP
ncbi:MAG: HEPN domain-containing protein [Nitrospirota bacterium]|nr:HEPN domain-containing protein [Nitrospirota bacterium]